MSSYKSKWGYHPTSFETFKKLKNLKKRYWQTVYAVARWRRWNKKTVNKIGSEPIYCPFFVEEKSSWVKKIGKDGQTSTYLLPKTLNDQGVLGAYENARIPVENSELVQLNQISEADINLLFEKVEDWFGKKN